MTTQRGRKVITDFQRRCLEALMELPNQIGSSEAIAYRLGKKGSHRLAITTSLNRLLDEKTVDDQTFRSDIGRYVCRLAPKDRWDTGRWAVTREGKEMLGYELVDGRWRKRDESTSREADHGPGR